MVSVLRIGAAVDCLCWIMRHEKLVAREWRVSPAALSGPNI